MGTGRHAVAIWAKGSVNETAAVGGHRWEPVVVRAAGQLLEAAAIGVDDPDLGAAFGAIRRLQKQALDTVEESVEDAEAEWA